MSAPVHNSSVSSSSSSSLKRKIYENENVSTPLISLDDSKKSRLSDNSGIDADVEFDSTQYNPLAALQRDTHGNIICPYLDTIDRKLLDFDFEKLCSVKHYLYI